MYANIKEPVDVLPTLTDNMSVHSTGKELDTRDRAVISVSSFFITQKEDMKYEKFNNSNTT